MIEILEQTSVEEFGGFRKAYLASLVAPFEVPATELFATVVARDEVIGAMVRTADQLDRTQSLVAPAYRPTPHGATQGRT